ncbi:MAG: hypothetical protein J2P36_10645 [Ktedonobacteraceae bacterium]|nr:hypothetical protein [Ktedonobacteraceae bacterium]
MPRVITVDQNAAYPSTLKKLKTIEVLPAAYQLRQTEYLNHLIEQEHQYWSNQDGAPFRLRLQ